MPFIVFEGLDACGKTTQMKLLCEKLEASGQSVLMTREPGGTPLGEKLRALLLSTEGQAPVPRCELLIYEACRAQLVDTVIQPALKSGQWVICDRFSASSVAFQAGGRKLNRAEIDWLNNYATAGLTPDMTVLVDVSVDESERRRRSREQNSGQAMDRFEKEKRAFHQSIYDSYQEQLKTEKGWVRVDGSQPVENVFASIWQEVERRQWLKS